jgi:signal peptidase
MEPAFARGDILFLSNPKKAIDIGEICVFKIPGRDIPIVHRVIDRHDSYVVFFVALCTLGCVQFASYVFN